MSKAQPTKRLGNHGAFQAELQSPLLINKKIPVLQPPSRRRLKNRCRSSRTRSFLLLHFAVGKVPGDTEHVLELSRESNRL